MPWLPDMLAQPPKQDVHGFYAAADFSVYDKSRKGQPPAQLEFLPIAMFSRNHSNPDWARKAPRRLKNIIITMDWVPDASQLSVDAAAPAKVLTPEQEAALREAFETLDADGSGCLEAAEVAVLLEAVGVEESVEAVMARADTDGNGSLDFGELRDVITRQQLFQLESGRYCVALSLAEAETVRALIHASPGEPLLPRHRSHPHRAASISLLAPEGLTLDSSFGHRSAPRENTLSTDSALRFINSDTAFEPRAINALLRQLQYHDAKVRLDWFLKVRSCRRRPRRDPAVTPLARIFSEVSEYHQLRRAALIARIRHQLYVRNLYVVDAFTRFDDDQNGTLSATELASAIAWLELQVNPTTVKELCDWMDSDHDGMISLNDWKHAIGPDARDLVYLDEADDGDGLVLDSMPLDAQGGANAAHGDESRDPATIEQLVIPELEDGNHASAVAVPGTPPTQAELWRVKASVVSPRGFKSPAVWIVHTKGAKGSIWAPSLSKPPLAASNKVRVCLGHYAMGSSSKPGGSANRAFLLELQDTGVLGVQSSPLLPRVLAQLLPNPIAYRLIWSRAGTAAPLHAWRPLPPSPDFVAIGVVCTVGAEPPALTEVRCVPASWVQPCATPPRMVWSDNGRGGRPGCLWSVDGPPESGALMLMAVTSSRQAPTDAKHLFAREFFLGGLADTISSAEDDEERA